MASIHDKSNWVLCVCIVEWFIYKTNQNVSTKVGRKLSKLI